MFLYAEWGHLWPSFFYIIYKLCNGEGSTIGIFLISERFMSRYPSQKMLTYYNATLSVM